MGPPSRKSHSAENRSNAAEASIDELTNRFELSHIRRPSRALRNARRARIRYLHFITLDESKYMWDGPENAELWRLQREEFAEEAAWKKEMDKPCNVFKKYMNSEPWDDDYSGAGGVAPGVATSGRAAAGEAASAGGAAVSVST